MSADGIRAAAKNRDLGSPPGSSEIKLHRFIVWAKLHLQRIVDVPPHLDRLKLWLLTAKHSLSG